MSYYIISSSKSIQNTVPSLNGDISTQNPYGATIVGYLAGLKNSGAFNVFVGMSSGANNNSGACNNFIGTNAGFNNVSGDGNTFLGTNAGYGNQTGIDNIFIGLRAGARNVSGVRNLAIGNNASQYINGNNNVYLGFNNTNTASDTLSSNNTSVGTYSVATGYQNITLGYSNSATRNADNSIIIGNYSTDVSCNNILLGNNIRNSGANVFILMNNASNNPPYSNNTSNLMNFNNAMLFYGDSNGNFNNGTMDTYVANILTKAYNQWNLQSSNGHSYMTLTDSNIIISNLSNNMTLDSNGLFFKANNITFSNSSNTLHFGDGDFTMKSVAASVSTVGSNVLVSSSNIVQVIGQNQVSLISSNSSIVVSPSNVNIVASNLLSEKASNLNWSATSGGQMSLSNNNFNVSTNTGAISLNSNGVSLTSPSNNVQISSQYLISLVASNSSIAITPSNIGVIAYCNLVLTGSNDVQITGPSQISMNSSCNILLNGSNSVQLSSSNLVALQSSNSYVLVTPSNVKITGFPDVQIVGPNTISLNTSNSGIVLGPTNVAITAASNVAIASGSNIALNGSNQVSIASSNIGLTASSNISLNTSNTINLTSSNASVVIDPTNVTISGASNVVLNGSNQVSLNSSNIGLAASSNISLNTSNTINLASSNTINLTSSNASIVIDPTNVTISGASNVALNGSNQISLSTSNTITMSSSNAGIVIDPTNVTISGASNVALNGSNQISLNSSNINVNASSNISLNTSNTINLASSNTIVLTSSNASVVIDPTNVIISGASNIALNGSNQISLNSSNINVNASSNVYIASSNQVSISGSNGCISIDSNGITLGSPGHVLDLSGFSNIVLPTGFNFSSGSGSGGGSGGGGGSGNINASNIIFNSGSNIIITGSNEVFITANNYVSLYAYDSGITISPCNILITASNLLLQEAYDFEWMAMSGGHISLSSNNYLVSTSYGFMDINSNGITLAAPGKTLDLSGFSNIIFPYNASNNGDYAAHIYVTCSNFATINDVYKDYEVTTLYGSTIVENNLYVGSNLICEKFQASITNINSCESLTLSTCNDLIFDGSNVIINGALQINGGFQVNGPNIVIGCGGVSKEEIYAHDPVVSEYPNGSVIIDSNLWVGGTIYAGAYCCQTLQLLQPNIVVGCGGITKEEIYANDPIVNEYPNGSLVVDSNLWVGGCIYAGSYCCKTIKALSFDLTADQSITFASPSNAIFNTPGISLSGSNPYIHSSNDLTLQASNVIIPNALSILNPSNSNCYWQQYIDSPFVHNSTTNASNMANNLVFKSCGGTVITFEDDFCPETLNFTGKHRCSPSDKSAFLRNKLKSKSGNETESQMLEELQGLIVIADGTYLDLQDKNEIHIDEAIPRIQLARRKADPRAFGVIGNIDKEGKYKIGNMFFMNTPKIQRFVVQSVGEGGIWVCNLGGNLKNGDYIMTSDLAGYGMRQSDNIHRNYTVAKITCDCNFKSNINAQNPTIFKRRTISFQGKKLKCCLVGCTYHF